MNSLTGQICESSHVIFAERIIPGQHINLLTFGNELDLVFEELDPAIAGGNYTVPIIQQQVQGQVITDSIPQMNDHQAITNSISPMTDDALDELLEDDLIPEVRRSNRNIIPMQRLNYGHNKISFIKHINSAKSEFAEALKDPKIVESMRKKIKHCLMLNVLVLLMNHQVARQLVIDG